MKTAYPSILESSARILLAGIDMCSERNRNPGRPAASREEIQAVELSITLARLALAGMEAYLKEIEATAE